MKAWKALPSIFGILLLCDIVLAQPSWIKYSRFKNWGGLNDNLAATEIADNEASDIQNVVFDTGGALKKRFGYSTIPNTAVHTITDGTNCDVTGLAFYKKADDSRYAIAIGNVGGKAVAARQTYDVGGGIPNTLWTFIDGSSVLPQSGYSTDNQVSWTVGENTLVFSMKANPTVRPFKWNASGWVQTLTSDTDCPKSSIVIYHKNHLFTNDLDNTSRVFYSKLDDITDWTPTDFIDVSTNDGSKVRGFSSSYDSLYIFKDKSIWRLSGYERDSWRLEKMVDGIGTLSPQSIASVNNLIYFVTNQNDVAVYDGGVNVAFLSSKIRNTLSGLNFSRASNALGIAFSTYKYMDTDYYSSVSLAGSATNNRILFFDTGFKAWSKFTGINANAWCVAEDSVGKNILLFGDYDGYVHSYPSSSYYDGDVSTTAINAYYQTKWFMYPEINNAEDKYWRVEKVYATSETTADVYLTVEFKSDYESAGETANILLSQAGSLWDVAVWDVDTWSGQSLITSRQEIEKGKSMFQTKFSNSDVNEGFTIFGWEDWIEPTERL